MRSVMVLVLSLLLVVVGCKKRPQRKIECVDSSIRLQKILDKHTTLDPTNPSDDLYLGLNIVEGDLEKLELDLSRLSLICPTDDDVRLVRAIVAIVDRDRPEAIRTLDELLARQVSHPEAAILRARLAIEVGGIGFARELLERQIRFQPDSASLYEALAAALFADGEYDAARQALDRAERLGAPTWRIHFNRGLIAEQAGEIEEAKGLYDQSLQANPGWTDSGARLRGLEARPPRTEP